MTTKTFPVDDAGALVCSTDTLVDTRMLIQSNSGGGKSFAVRRILEQTHGHVQQLVVDPEGEFSSLRERYDYVHAAAADGDCVAHPRSAALLAERLLKLGVSAILDLYELQAHERVRFVRLFLEALIDAPKNLWHPVLVIIDEAHVYAPEKGSAESCAAVIDLASRGRKRGFAAVLATQRIQKLHKDAAAELSNKLIGRTTLDVDLARAADELGFAKSSWSTLKELPAGHFFASGPAFSARGVTRVHVGSVRTTHPKAGSRIAFVAPPPTSAIRALLPQLADLPAEAEKREQTIEELQETIDALRREPEKLRAEIVRLEAEAAARLPAWQGLAFTELRETNVLRCTSRGGFNQKLAEWTPLEWAGAAAGELGEMANLVKKMRRGESIPVGDVADEIADVVIYLDLLAALLKVDLGEAVVAKFNKTSKKRGIDILLGTDPPPPLLRPHHAAPDAAKADAKYGDDWARERERALTTLHPTHAREQKPGLAKGQRAILTVLAQSPDGSSKSRTALLASYAPGGGGYNNYLSALRTSGYITTSGDTLHITPEGARALEAVESVARLPTGAALRDFWLNKCGKAERAALSVIFAAYPRAVTKEAVARAAGYEAAGGGFNNALSRLRTMGLITGRGELRADDALFQKR